MVPQNVDTGSSGGDSGSGALWPNSAAAAQLAYDEATKNAKEAGIDTNAQEKIKTKPGEKMLRS